MQLDTCRGRCPKKVLSIGETTGCFYTHDTEQVCRPRRSTFLDGRGYDRFLHVARIYPYYTALSLAQLLLLIVGLTGMVLGRDQVATQLAAQLEGLIGPAGRELVTSIL